jgi:flagellar motor switch/type III secretory pathway protein FliN
MSDGMPGEVQPWLLLGERRRRSLENRVRVAAERWAAHWVADTGIPSVAVEPAVENPTLEYGDPKTIAFGARGKSGEWLAKLVVPHRVAAWAAGLGAVEFSATADLDEMSPLGTSPLPRLRSPGGEIELELMRGFWATLVPQSVAMDAPLESLDDAYADEARLALAKRGLRTLCSFGPAPGLSIQATLSPSTVATLLAERRGSYVGESLTSRRSAFTQAPVALDCCLGSVQVPVRDLHSLRIGDVLVTDIALDGHAELRVRNKPRPIAAGTLGEVEGRKALKVETAQVVTANRGSRR